MILFQNSRQLPHHRMVEEGFWDISHDSDWVRSQLHQFFPDWYLTNQCPKNSSDGNFRTSLWSICCYSTILMDCFPNSQPHHCLPQLKYSFSPVDVGNILLHLNFSKSAFKSYRLCFIDGNMSPFSFLHTRSPCFSVLIIFSTILTTLFALFFFFLVCCLVGLVWFCLGFFRDYSSDISFLKKEKITQVDFGRFKRLFRTFFIQYVFTVRIYSLTHLNIMCFLN